MKNPKKCSHENKALGVHHFKFPILEYVGERNVWNPFEPTCEKCGLTIGQLFKEYQRLRKVNK